MKRRITTGSIALLLICALLALATVAQAGVQPQSTGYSIDSWTVGASGTSSGGSFVLNGAAGQPGTGTLSGGNFSLDGGFWGHAGETLYKLFLPVIMRNY